MVTDPLVREANIPPASSGVHGSPAAVVHFTALTFFPCHGRLPLSAVCLYLGDTLAALGRCHASDLCASLGSPKGPLEARVWGFSSLCMPWEAKFGKRTDLSCSFSHRSGNTSVFKSPSWEEVV